MLNINIQQSIQQSFLKKMLNYAAWTGQSAVGWPREQKQTFLEVENQPSKQGE